MQDVEYAPPTPEMVALFHEYCELIGPIMTDETRAMSGQARCQMLAHFLGFCISVLRLSPKSKEAILDVAVDNLRRAYAHHIANPAPATRQ